MKYYKTIDKIPVFTFYQIIDNNDVCYLIKKYNKNNQLEISKNLKTQLNISFLDIVKEFNAINSDNKSVRKMRIKSEIDYLTGIYDTAKKVVELYEQTLSIEVLFLLNEFDFKFDSSKNIDNQLKVILRKIKTLKMKIKILKSKFEREYNIDSNNSNNNIKHLDQLEKRAIMLENNLGKKYPINTKKTSLLRWCNLVELSNQKNRANG